MAAPVWVLSVDLQTKTATFQSGLADAARSARGAFSDIKSGAGEMGGSVSYSTMEARHSVMMLGEEFGVHLPRSLTTFISSLGPLGPALEMAFPFLAVILGATLLLEHLSKLKEAGEKLTEEQDKYGRTAQEAFAKLDDKMLMAEKRADELKGDHIGALRKELELIDHASMDDLIKTFGDLAKQSDVIFAQIKSHWYTFGSGAEGAKASLERFSSAYQTLLLKRDDKDAGTLLNDTIAREEKILALRKAASSTQDTGTGTDQQWANSVAQQKARNELSAMGLTHSEDELKAQQQLVNTLHDTLTVSQQIVAVATKDKGNATTAEGKKDGKEAAERAKLLAEAQQKGVDEEGRIIREANRAAEEATAEGWREQVNATRQGSDERLQVIDAAIEDEKARGMETTGFYRELLSSRVTLIRQMDDEGRKIDADGKREQADNEEKMGMLRVAREKQQMALEDSARRATRDQQISEESRIANLTYEIKHNALEKQIEALDQSGNNYLNQLKALQNKEKQLYKQHEDELSAIREKAEIETNNKLSASYQQFTSTISGELTKSIMGHQTWAKMVESLGDQAISSMIQHGIEYAVSNKFRQESDARAAASAGFKFGMEYGGPAAPILAPTIAAIAFAGALAFEGGTDRVPGMGRGDIVPSMLEPGEGVVPGGVMDGLRNVARNGGFGQSPSMTVHVRPTYHVQTISGDGMRAVLDKHSDQLQQHFETALRKMNR